MEYSNKLFQTPSPKRESSDRFLSPSRTPSSQLLLNKDELTKSNVFSKHLKLSTPPSKRLTSSLSCFSPTKSSDSFDLSSSPLKKRHYPTHPIQIIQLNGIQSDFYAQAMDWSKNNIIAIALESSMCYINPKNWDVIIPLDSMINVSSVKYDESGVFLALGNRKGELMIYDGNYMKTSPIGTAYKLFDSPAFNIDWKNNTIIAGSNDGTFCLLDVREESIIESIAGDIEGICAVRFAPDLTHIVTSSESCRIKVWDIRNMEKPQIIFTKHNASSKAICWSPLYPNIIVTGGGTKDTFLHKWDMLTGEVLQSKETTTQVCNAIWNAEFNEIVTSHGFTSSPVSLWRGANLDNIASYYTHKERVLYMAQAPDCSFIATAAPDDTLQIWNFFQTHSTLDVMETYR